jgi:hypothetical protein
VVKKFGKPMEKHTITLEEGKAVEIFTHDEYGIAIDPKVWAQEKKKRCCEGRGFVWTRSSRTERVQTPDGKVFEASRPHREMTPCQCAIERYQKFRNKVEWRLIKAVQRGEDPAGELMKIHAEHGHQIKIESRQTGGEENLIQVVTK